MYILLILFFGSLGAIIIMIGRKLLVLEHEEILTQEDILFEVPYLKEIKHATVKNTRKHGYALLVETIRLYIRSSNLVKNKYEEAKNKMKERKEKFSGAEKIEISKFLKVVGDYKRKIRDIKHKIKEEEKNS